MTACGTDHWYDLTTVEGAPTVVNFARVVAVTEGTTLVGGQQRPASWISFGTGSGMWVRESLADIWGTE